MIEKIVSKVADENTNDVLGHVRFQLAAHNAATTSRRQQQRRVGFETVRTLGTTRGCRYAAAIVEQDRVNVS